MNARRRVEVLHEGTWAPVEGGLRGVRPGDVCRMFEPDGAPVDDGRPFRSTSEPYPVDGGWGVESEAVDGSEIAAAVVRRALASAFAQDRATEEIRVPMEAREFEFSIDLKLDEPDPPKEP